MYHRASLSVVILLQFLLELCLFVNLEYSKYTVFRTFLLHALTYWAEILHMTLFYCTTDQVRVTSICVNFCGSYVPFWNLEYWKYTVSHTFLLHPLTYWAESMHITLFYCTTDQVWVSSICVYFGVMPLSELRILEIHSFPHFSLTCFDILSWNFAYDFVLLYYRSRSSDINLRQFLWELYPFWNVEYWIYTVSRTFLLHPLTYWAESMHITLFYCTTGQLRVSSISVNFCRSNVPFWTKNTGNTQFSALFSCVLWHIELKFFI